MRRDEKLELLELLEEKRRRLARNDLNAFCRYIEIPGVPVSDSDDCDEFYPDNVTPAEHHILLNNALMQVERGYIKRLMVFMPPGSAKSTYATVTFPTWAMGRRAGRNIISASYGSDLATKFGRKCRQIVRGRHYSEIFGCGLVQDNKAADDWSITNGSTYMSGGILSGITGNRADGLVIDDPLKGREAADSPVIRDKIYEEYRSSLRTRLKPRGFIVIIQTRWHEDDLSGRILPKEWNGESGWINSRDGEPWYVICLAAQCEQPNDPLGRQIGEWLWTDWFTPEHWERERIVQGERNWGSLYQQTPKPTDGGIFKRRWPQSYNTPPAEGLVIQSVDTGNKPGELNDPSVCGTWIITRHGYYLVDIWRDQVDFPTLKRTTKNLFAKWQPAGVIIEDKASGQQLIQELRAETRIPVIAFDPTPHGDKIMRANSVSPIVESGMLYLPEEAPWLFDFESEFFSFPLSTKKDQVDMVSQFLRWAHKNTVSLEAWGTGQRMAGLDAYGGESHIDEDTGYGTVSSGTDLSGF